MREEEAMSKSSGVKSVFCIRPLRAAVAVVAVTALLTGCGSSEDRAQGYYQSGMALIEKNDDFAARLELYKALKYKSDKIEVWRALAGIHERLKEPANYFRDLRRVVELDPNDLDARLKLARLMASGGAAEAALRVLDAAREGDKPSAQLHSTRAIALLRMNDGAGAMLEAQRAFDLDPTDSDALAILASKKSSEGDLDGALKLLDSAAVGSKDETRTALQRIEIYVRKKDFAKAEELLRPLIAQNPREAAYHDRLIQVLAAQRKFDEAEKEFRNRIAADPANSKLGIEFVRFLIATKGAEAGRAELETRIKSSVDNFEYRMVMVELDLAQNKSDEAIQALQQLAASTDKPERAASAQLRLAQIYIIKRNTTAADSLIDSLLSKDRKNAGALQLRATRRIENGKIDDAVSDLREALNEQPKSIDLLLLMAIAYERGGKNELADRQYADALKSSNFNPEVTLRYVAYLQRRSDLSRAEEVLTEAMDRNPNNIQILSSLGQVRLNRQNWSGALTIADAISLLNDGRAVADQIRAGAFAGQNKIDESISALEDAHKAAPNAVQPVLVLASTYVKQGKPDKAVALLKELSDKAPNNAQFLVFLGQAQLAQKKDQDALQSFRKAVAQQPKDPAGYSALTDFYIRSKDYESASTLLQAALREMPANINLRLSSAGLKILRGDNEAAIGEYEAILNDQPNSLVAINNLVSLILDNRSDKPSIDRAIGLSEKLKNSSLPQFQDTIGWAEYKRGDFKSAITVLEGVVSKTPNLAAARYHLGMSYVADGQKDKATEQFKMALTLEPDGSALKESIKAALK